MRVLFVASNRKGKGLSPFINSQKESIEKLSVQIDVFLIPGKGFCNYIKSIRLIRAECKKKNYDIIHAHYGFSGLIVLLAFLKKPVVISFMGDDLLGTSTEKGRNTIKSVLIARINRALSPLYNSVIVKSKQLGSLLPKIPFHIIPNGVDFEKYYPYDKQEARKKLGIDLQAKVVVFAASKDSPNKNFKLAKNSISLLQDKLTLLILENTPPHEVYFYFNAADLVLLLSFHEGSPNVIKEAMACNCPIVSTNVGDVEEVINKTEGCFICSYKPEDVAEKITKAIKFGKRTNGREMIKHLESGVVAKEIVALYESINKS